MARWNLVFLACCVLSRALEQVSTVRSWVCVPLYHGSLGLLVLKSLCPFSQDQGGYMLKWAPGRAPKRPPNCTGCMRVPVQGPGHSSFLLHAFPEAELTQSTTHSNAGPTVCVTGPSGDVLLQTPPCLFLFVFPVAEHSSWVMIIYPTGLCVPPRSLSWFSLRCELFVEQHLVQSKHWAGTWCLILISLWL